MVSSSAQLTSKSSRRLACDASISAPNAVKVAGRERVGRRPTRAFSVITWRQRR